jgi:hypothetical protein
VNTERFEYIEVDSTDKNELRHREAEGFLIYGVSRDLRSDHTSYIKLRKPLGKEGKK